MDSIIRRTDGIRTKLWLYSIARRALAIQTEAVENARRTAADNEQEFNEMTSRLSPSRIINRLHAIGIDCNQDDLTQSEALGDLTSKEAGLSLEEVAMLVGADSAKFKEWLSGAPADAPALTEVYKSAGGRITVYDYFDAIMLQRWMKENGIVLAA